MQINKQEIQARKEKLEACKEHLKKEFIGIDGIIDSLLDYIQVWYLMPEALNRPVIVNLWGMTGVGKTDLIRKMVKFLDFQDRFTEVELSNIDQSSYVNNVSQILSNHELNDEKPAIVLFDEIQRFYTIDQDGKPVPQTKFMDFWELLSDGRLSKKQKEDLDYFLYQYITRQKDNAKKKDRGEVIENENPAISIWDAKTLQSSLGFGGGVMDMAEMSESQMIELIKQAKNKKKIYEPVNHSKTLIIVSGNLDEAFTMARQSSEADIDPDIFHAYTKKITVVDVKNALSRKFRPEQVARFGNIHLIYNSLRKVDFESLISKEVKRIITETQEKYGLKINVGDAIKKLIYDNGVFPVQGVRPVFSSIIDILDANLSNFIFEAIMTDQKKVSIDYDTSKQQIVAKVGEKEIRIPYVGRIDKIRQANEADTVANISVHECGHAVAYMCLMGLAPLQLKSKIASSYAGGFTFPHEIHETRENIINKIKIYLAGGIAEEVVFGKNNASVGRSNDREHVTILAIDYVRKYGFDDEFQSVYNIENYSHRMDQSVTDTDVEKMTARLVGETKELLSQHHALLKELSIELCLRGNMDAKEVAAMGKKHGLSVLVKEEGFLNIVGYNAKLQGIT
jgi:Peptidase family M41/ATPase family associated with various cellular activities (AAA)